MAPKIRGRKVKGSIGITSDPRLAHLNREAGEGHAAPPDEGETTWSRLRNSPVAQVVGSLLSAQRRTVVMGTAPPVEAEAMVMHHEMPAAAAHPLKYRDSCGLCISYAAMGRAPATVEMGMACPNCGASRGHQPGCERVLAEHGVYESDWTDLPTQIGNTDFQKFWQARSRG